MDYTVHGILQARILEWVAFPFSGASSQPRDQTGVSCIAGGFFTSWAMVFGLTSRSWLNSWSMRKSDRSTFSLCCCITSTEGGVTVLEDPHNCPFFMLFKKKKSNNRKPQTTQNETFLILPEIRICSRFKLPARPLSELFFLVAAKVLGPKTLGNLGCLDSNASSSIYFSGRTRERSSNPFELQFSYV